MSVAAQAIPKAQLSWRLNTCRAFPALGAAAGLLLVAFPEIDLFIAQATFSPATGFIAWRLGWLAVVRSAFVVFFFATVTVALVGWLASRMGTAGPFGAKEWLFLLVCLSVGPGLLANVGFKDNWGRARPKQIVAFGGNKVFTPALLPTNQCKRNCSFVSGEASSVFAPFYAAAAIVPQWAATLIVVGTAAGLSAGIVRIAQGAHFLSDVVFAGLFMGLLTLALQRLMLAPRGSWPVVFKNRLPARPIARTSAPGARACVSPKLTAAAARLQVGALATSPRLTTGGPRASPDSSSPHHP